MHFDLPMPYMGWVWLASNGNSARTMWKRKVTK